MKYVALLILLSPFVALLAWLTWQAPVFMTCTLLWFGSFGYMAARDWE